MVDQKRRFDLQNEEELAKRVEKAKEEYLEEMNQIRVANAKLSEDLEEEKRKHQELAERNKEFEKEYLSVAKEKDD